MCRAAACALTNASPITNLDLFRCYFPQGDGGTIVNALRRNSTLKTLRIEVGNRYDEDLSCVVASMLAVNTTLEGLTVNFPRYHEDDAWLELIFRVLGRVNRSLLSLNVDGFPLADRRVGNALREVLEENEVLEDLAVKCSGELREIDLLLWKDNLSFRRTNDSLRYLALSFLGRADQSQVTTLCINASAQLEENDALNVLAIDSSSSMSARNYISVLEAVRPASSVEASTLGLIWTRSFKRKDAV